MNKAEINQLAKAIKPAIFEAVSSQSDEVLTVKDVASMLQISTDAVRMRCKRKQLPFTKKNRRLYFSKNAIIKHYLST